MNYQRNLKLVRFKTTLTANRADSADAQYLPLANVQSSPKGSDLNARPYTLPLRPRILHLSLRTAQGQGPAQGQQRWRNLNIGHYKHT